MIKTDWERMAQMETLVHINQKLLDMAVKTKLDLPNCHTQADKIRNQARRKALIDAAEMVANEIKIER